MWVPKWERDRKKGVDSPIPTQPVSNEEFVPRPQNDDQKRWEKLIGELAEEKSKKLGMERRDFMRSSMGMATAFYAANLVFGPYWDVDAAETLEKDATYEKFPKGEYFVIDVQTHFTDGVPIGSPELKLWPETLAAASQPQPHPPRDSTAPPKGPTGTAQRTQGHHPSVAPALGARSAPG